MEEIKKTRLRVGRYSVSVFAPVSCWGSSVVYIHNAGEDAEAVFALRRGAAFVLVSIEGVDWNRCLSPWPAPRAFHSGADFAGGADLYLKELTENIVPAVEAKLGFTPCFRSIAGYSLAGLFAIYSLYRTDIFSCVASVSGSLWYDGFLNFMKKNRPIRPPERAYFSLGDREKKIGNRRLASVETCTVKAADLIQSLGSHTTFELNPGNHFRDVPERIAKGLRWISI